MGGVGEEEKKGARSPVHNRSVSSLYVSHAGAGEGAGTGQGAGTGSRDRGCDQGQRIVAWLGGRGREAVSGFVQGSERWDDSVYGAEQARDEPLGERHRVRVWVDSSDWKFACIDKRTWLPRLKFNTTKIVFHARVFSQQHPLRVHEYKSQADAHASSLQSMGSSGSSNLSVQMSEDAGGGGDENMISGAEEDEATDYVFRIITTFKPENLREYCACVSAY